MITNEKITSILDIKAIDREELTESNLLILEQAQEVANEKGHYLLESHLRSFVRIQREIAKNGGVPIARQILIHLEDPTFDINEKNDNTGEFYNLNFMIDHDSLDFVGYEFDGKEIEVEESGSEESLFRMDISKKTEEISVYVAYSQDYDVMDDVTSYFDTEKLYKDILQAVKDKGVENVGEIFVKYCELVKEGEDSDRAASKAYSWYESQQSQS